jgi:hypothetical protein
MTSQGNVLSARKYFSRKYLSRSCSSYMTYR